MATTVLTVPDISCEHCERAIKNALTPLDGVKVVEVNIPEHLVRIDFDATLANVARFQEVLQEEDYPVASVDGRAV